MDRIVSLLAPYVNAATPYISKAWKQRRVFFAVTAVIWGLLGGWLVLHYMFIPPTTDLKVSRPKVGQYGIFLKELCGDPDHPTDHGFLGRVSTENDYEITAINYVITDGSVDTVEQINAGNVDIGLIQSDTRSQPSIDEGKVRTIAFVFDEVFLWITPKDTPIMNPYAIARGDSPNHAIGTFEPKSQTAVDLKKVLQFYEHVGQEFSTDKELQDAKLLRETLTVKPCGYEEGVRLLNNKVKLLQYEKKLAAGIDADALGPAPQGETVNSLFFVSGLGNHKIRELFGQTDFAFVKFLHQEALLRRYPEFSKSKIPKGMFGEHSKEYESPAVRATLVASSDLNDRLVYHLTRQLFEYEGELVRAYPYTDIQKVSPNLKLLYPLHDGAAAYYRKDEPSFVDEYYRVLALCVASFGLLVSVTSLLVSRRRRRRRRLAQARGE